ncbi:OmpA family protein [Wenzhouxiangella sp. EGI_FJ10305]|uniref:OmpA family protein n=1 Tax=Wenzhouxiangella sp. EGI_FJ10305 TaxID=3243768 RepID=UPI0035DADE8C
MNNYSGKILLAAVLAAGLGLAGCATYTGQTTDPDDPNRTRTGALIGAGIGAVAGLLSGDDATERRQRAMIGAGVGAIAGGAVGVYQDRQEAELRRSLAGTGVDVVREGDNITLSMPGAITFGFDSAEVQPRFLSVLDTLSDTLNEYNQTVIEIAGHTDSTGSPEYNQGLSERRAAAVDNYLGNRGVLRDRTLVVGAGQTYPIASNATESGRAQNRRVEITLVPMQS